MDSYSGPRGTRGTRPSLRFALTEVIEEDVAEEDFLFIAERRCGLADPPQMLVASRPAELVVQIRDADHHLAHKTSIFPRPPLRARGQHPLLDKSPDEVVAALMTFRRGRHIEPFAVGHQIPPAISGHTENAPRCRSSRCQYVTHSPRTHRQPIESVEI